MIFLSFVEIVFRGNTFLGCFGESEIVLNYAYFCLFKLSCDSRFQGAFTACICVFKVITLVGSNQRNYFENATACCKRTLKTTVTTQL